MASPDSGARATVANASGDAAEDGDALASKRRRLTGADAEPSQADDSVSDGATRRARRPRWRRQTPRDPAEGFDGWHDLPEGILLSVFESLARGPDGRRLVRPAATTARAHPRTLRGARNATQMPPPPRATERHPSLPPDLTRPFPPLPIPRAALQLRPGVQGVARRRDGRPDARHGRVRPRRASFRRGRPRGTRTFQAKRRRHRHHAARQTRRERRDGRRIRRVQLETTKGAECGRRRYLRPGRGGRLASRGRRRRRRRRRVGGCGVRGALARGRKRNGGRHRRRRGLNPGPPRSRRRLSRSRALYSTTRTSRDGRVGSIRRSSVSRVSRNL